MIYLYEVFVCLCLGICIVLLYEEQELTEGVDNTLTTIIFFSLKLLPFSSRKRKKREEQARRKLADAKEIEAKEIEAKEAEKKSKLVAETAVVKHPVTSEPDSVEVEAKGDTVPEVTPVEDHISVGTTVVTAVDAVEGLLDQSKVLLSTEADAGMDMDISDISKIAHDDVFASMVSENDNATADTYSKSIFNNNADEPSSFHGSSIGMIFSGEVLPSSSLDELRNGSLDLLSQSAPRINPSVVVDAAALRLPPPGMHRCSKDNHQKSHLFFHFT